MSNEKLDWKPEVGKTAWYFCGMTNKRVFCATVLSLDENEQVGKTAIVDGPVDGNRLLNVRYLYPSMEAALASIKIYDLEGKEVVIPRAQDKIIIEMCDRAAEQIANLSEWDDADYAQLGMAPIINAFKEIIAVRDRAAIKMVAKLVYEMNLPENPEGEARLKAAQERFKSAIGGKSDQREGGC